MNTLLIEIGSEEIPAGYIIPALDAFKENILSALDKSRIDHGIAHTLGTPRRLALIIEDLADMQTARTSTITGPPERVGFDENGNPTLAAEKFASKARVAVDQIKVEETPKGRYLTAVIEEKCESSVSILESILEHEILSIPFPKRMKWGDLSISFARPIISLVGLLGDKILDFKVGNIKSSPRIFGHPFMCPGKHKIESADDYIAVAEKAGVVPDIEKRKELLTNAIEACAKEHHSHILEDDDLIDIVTNLVEYPFPVVGGFDEQFLEVPDEVLITAMREHQKYFALVDGKGNLKPLFIAVNNTKANDMQLVARGHEKVLRARLSDAKFFYEVDCKSSLDEFAQKLKNVTFQEKLGTVYEKTLRIGTLVEYLAMVSSYEDKETLKQNVARAAQICKADLVSQVVIEFTKLQGIIGRAYAQKAGEQQDVALAIEQHYRPVYSGGKLPENPTACLLAISDKLDTICGCFSVGLIPTGGADPYALRRQGIGIIQIMLEENLDVSLTAMIDKGLEAYMDDAAKREETALKIKDFFKNRMINILTDMGFSKEAVNSALWASFDNIPDVVLRVRALDSLRKEPDFEPLSITFKRVGNILKKTAGTEDLSVDQNLFEDPSESALFSATNEVRQLVNDLIQEGNYDTALSHIATLRPKVDSFFDDVMVMAEDTKLRQNRIALLSSVSGLFENIADFSMI
ncbi:glycine--tRNA ligase subunit beta [Desulfobacula toluolica]|uniref:Glycine--tRNA ligase beta subunit n=1 Tax=Desulfobacula toluolica (strain DSM 7467 / Tol2) TaxID=651182 RepID=K0NNN8_DESTT|nr:glycine--tRNA ligase subunit beta [Desulfobacula toluolica]CCK80382.1 GlyS: glycyl-tRNA synthetase, beta subunit [Desulfobacula toluolica Tol2]